ncbi:hypothetical protein PAEPH01_2019 [Pancytospora epiphaga]|nr:hypothetical protein PAEPH01_2019 [Pancytospora epiphaga]
MKTGEIRMCIDYRKLNEVAIKGSYPLPRIDEIIDELSQATIFSSLDATSGYYQIEIEETDRDKTAFLWKNSLYKYTRMPFWLCNALETFQQAMDVTLREGIGRHTYPYLDDIKYTPRPFENIRLTFETF